MADQPEVEREAFLKKMIDILNYGALNLAMAIGYRTGLYDALDAFDHPETLSNMAEKSGLNPRYVKEWLGVMVTGGIVEMSRGEDGESRFHLPKAHGDIIARRAGDSNLGVYTQEIPILTASAMDVVVERFHTGQGVDYGHYPRFQAFMSELADAKHRQVLIEKFLPSVGDGRLVQGLTDGIRVCDLGCGEGTALLLMAEAFPASRFTGIDLSEGAIREARRSSQHRGLANVEFVIADAVKLKECTGFKGVFDYVTAFDAIHDQTRPLEALNGIYYILADGGAFSMVDIAAGTSLADNLSHPMGPFLYTVSLMHCMPVGLVDGGTGLGMMWGREMAVEMLGQAGFKHVEVVEMPHDPFNLHFYCRK